GHRRDGEGTGGGRDHQLAMSLAEALDEVAAPARLFGDEPAGDALETRPPEGPYPRPRQDRAEFVLPDGDQLGLGVGRQIPWVALDEFGERIMHGNAELGPAGIGVELIERPETEDVAGIDRIGIAGPGLDLGHRELARPGGKRRAGRDRPARAAGAPLDPRTGR